MSLFIHYWTLASFATLIITAPMWPIMPVWSWSVPCLVWLLLSYYCRRLRWGCGIAAALIVILISGNLLRHQSNTLFQAGSNIIINAEVTSLFRPTSHGFRGIASVRSINGERLNYLFRPKVYLITQKNLQLGDRITARVRLKPIVGVLNEVGFDREKYAVSQGVTGVASVNNKHSYFIVSHASTRQLLFNLMFQASNAFTNQGLLLALSFGERAYIPSSQWLALQQSGLSHLIAISGLHVGIAFSVGWFFGLGLVRFGAKTVWLPIALGGVAALAYAWLAGFAIPTQRALWMVGVLMGLKLTRSHTSYRFTWLFVVCALLLVQPLAVYSHSFWLSVAAVAVIFWLLSLKLPIRSVLLKALLMQFCLVATMALLVAWLYQSLSVNALLYNLIFVPWFSFVVIPLLLLAVLMTALSPFLATLVLSLVDRLLVPVSEALSFSDVLWFELSNKQVLGLGVVFIAALFTLVVKKHALLILIMSLVFALISRREGDTWRMDMLDVGHGLAVVIEKNNRALLYDTGAAWEQTMAQKGAESDLATSQGSYAQQVIVPMLVARGVSVDGVIVSHFDNDHAGGLDVILQRWPKAQLWASQKDNKYQRRSEACIAGQSWTWQGIDIEVLWPPKLTKRAYNPHSCVVRLQDSQFGHTVLLTGDIESVAEWMLQRQAQSLDSEIIVVPHHGSKTSSSSAFISRVSPQLALASSAFQGRWLLPNPAVKSRYIDAGSQWLDTGTSGLISIQYRGKNRHLMTLRASKGLAWYRQMLRKRVE